MSTTTALLFCICTSVLVMIAIIVVIVVVRWRTRIGMLVNLVRLVMAPAQQPRARSGALGAVLRDVLTDASPSVPVHVPTRGTPRRHYDAVDMVLTPTEQQFATVLRDSLPAAYDIMVQVALQRVVTVRNPRRGQPWRDKRWNQISQKSLDFVVVRSADSKIILAIELDDATHLQANRIARDELLDTIMADAGVPLVHVPVQSHYDGHALQMQVLGYLSQ